MFKIPDKIPTRRSSAQEWADYAEFKSIINQSPISLRVLIKNPLLISDETDNEGAQDETDRFIAFVDDISSEINYRISISNGGYPFILTNNDYVLEYNSTGNQYDIIYKYLLLATRHKMTTTNRIQNGIDGALLFESLSAEVARNFFGNRAEVDVFGTSRSNEGGFREKLTNTFRRVGEGGALRTHPAYRPQDDKVDVIVWKGFSDLRTSKMIGLGQCKTGTSWQANTGELNVSSFCKTWFTESIVVDPLKMFFTAQDFPREIWDARAYQAGLVFDRFRIIDYLPDPLDPNLLNDIAEWTAGAEFFIPPQNS
jgi:hypothetical protein